MTYGSHAYSNAAYASTASGGVELTGTATVSYTATSTETATATVSGTATPTYTASGFFPGIAVGTATVSYTPTATVSAVSDIEGTATATYAAASTEEGVAEPVGTARATFNGSSTVTVISNVAGTANASYDTVGAVNFPLATEGVLWYINRADQATATALNGETSNFPDVTIGEETTFSFYIKQDTGYPVSSAIDDAKARYNRVVEWGKYAGYATVNRTLSSVYFRENDYPNADIDSHLVSIEPGDGVDQARGVWGIITAVDDSTEIFGAIAQVDVSVTVLGQYDDYADETAVRADLEV